MKTPKEWLAHIKQASDTEVRYGSSVILLESDIEAIFMEGWQMGMTYAAEIASQWESAHAAANAIESEASKKLTRQISNVV